MIKIKNFATQFKNKAGKLNLFLVHDKELLRFNVTWISVFYQYLTFYLLLYPNI